MKILRTVKDLRLWRSTHKTLGMVPTMGALHAGHLDLVSQSLKNNSATLLSVFVNPSQFAPHEDLDKYPRTFDEDVAKFRARAIEIWGAQAVENTDGLAVFCPKVEEIYPSGIDLRVSHQKGTFVEVLGVSHQLEGKIRPQFFRGVATVVTKLLNAAQPTRAYFGQKDVQQTVVVRQMVRDLLMPVEIVVCPTAREPNGLALSSRNVYLSEEEKEKMSVIYKALHRAQQRAQQALNENKSLSSSEVVNGVMELLATEDAIIDEVEYVSLNHPDDFAEVDEISKGTILSLAVKLSNGVRLIDNVVI